MTEHPTPGGGGSLYTAHFLATLAMLFLLGAGVTLLLFSLAYLQDLETLRTVPDAIWNFVCGRPVEGGIGLPLLLTVGTLSLLGSGVLFAGKRFVAWRANRRH
ncbi:MAG: hypothetical protein JW910_13235 [Anaerolineae bacterium]|nr:hypothetical protein [Anaerolineae bacterium]